MRTTTKYQHGTDPAVEPGSVPVRDATTVMIVDDRPELHVLMVQRSAGAVFGPSAWVFPGGRLDPTDADELDEFTTGLTAEQASLMLGVEVDGRAWWFAGVRETLEEAGLLLGTDLADALIVDSLRRRVSEENARLGQCLRTMELKIDLSLLLEVARFVTPEGPPRRFDTRFLLTRAPDGQRVIHDESEITQYRWIRPSQAIEAWRAEQFPLMSVTHRMLASLGRYKNSSDVLAAAGQRRPGHRVRVNDPDGEYLVLLPGDPDYDEAELEVEHGWVRI